jgi:hypothetical protein
MYLASGKMQPPHSSLLGIFSCARRLSGELMIVGSDVEENHVETLGKIKNMQAISKANKRGKTLAPCAFA